MARKTWSSVIVVLLIVATEAPAEAYLDPGAGSMLLQVLLGGIAAAGVFAKLFWHRITAPFRRGKPADQEQSPS